MNLRYKKVAAALTALALVAATPVFAADPPTITITSGPEDGAVVATSSVAFSFEAANASSTNCSLAGAGEESEPYTCGSPQSFTLPDGSYVFVVEATAATSSASVERAFSIDTDEATTTDEDTPNEDEPDTNISNNNSGGGFKRYNTPVVVVGATIAGEDNDSSNFVGGAGDLSDFPTYITPVAPAPASSFTTNLPTRNTVAVAPRVSAQVGGTVEQDENISTTTATSAVPSAIGTSTLGNAAAAAAGSAAAIPTWVWFALAILLLAVLLYWAYRSSVEYETPR